MKRFLIFAVAALVLLVGGWVGVYDYGLYIDFRPDEQARAVFQTDGRLMQVRLEDGSFGAMNIRAVELSGSMPGHHATQCAPGEEDYLRWMEQIGEMGANAVQTASLMDDEFYNALYAYNTAHDAPLYLIQGISVSDEANYGEKDAYADDFYGSLVRDGKRAVDIIHGRRNLNVAQSGAGGRYRADVSPWTLGYLVGSEWNDDTVAYTDHSVSRPESYTGKYFATGENASRFEALLADVMDTMVSYEADKYKEMRLIAFANDPSNDPFEYSTEYARQLPKFSRIDAEHIRAQGGYGGFFAAYRLDNSCSDCLSLFSVDQREALSDIIAGIDTEGAYDGYLELLGKYHKLPVYVMGYGFSTSRGVAEAKQGPLSEQEQGEELVRVWREALDGGLAGVCISSWQDTWERRTWNTAFATVLTRTPYWHDLQGVGQNRGLLAFAPGKEESVCILDGNPSEWGEEDVVASADGRTLSLRFDPEGVYLMIRGENLADESLYLPIDISGQVGSFVCGQPPLTFDRQADFVLCLEGEAGGRFLVQERYHAVWENYGYEINRVNPFENPPSREGDAFALSAMAADADIMLSARDLIDIEAGRKKAPGSLVLWETGRLRCGNGDPQAKDYDSLADLCYGAGCVEVRIPWLLLNVADPSQMQIHQDYYDYYGVSTEPAQGLWIGLGDGQDGEISLNFVELTGWNDRLEWRERLKASYFIVRQAWKGEAE